MPTIPIAMSQEQRQVWENMQVLHKEIMRVLTHPDSREFFPDDGTDYALIMGALMLTLGRFAGRAAVEPMLKSLKSHKTLLDIPFKEGFQWGVDDTGGSGASH